MPICNLWDTSGDAWMCTSIGLVQHLIRQDPRSVKRRGGAWNEIPIYYAIRYGATVEIIIWLAGEAGIEQLQHWRGHVESMLHVAVIYNRPFAIPFLLFACPDHVGRRFGSSKTPYQYAKKLKHQKCIKLLNYPEKTREEYVKDPSKPIEEYPFMKMISTLWDNSSLWQFTDLDHVKWLVNKALGSLLVRSGTYLCLPIWYAISCGGAADVVEWICLNTGLEHVSDLRSPCNGYTVMHLAVLNRHTHLIPYLLTIMPEAVNIKSKRDSKFGRSEGMTPLQYAKRMGNFTCFALISKLHKKYKAKSKLKMISDLCDDQNWPKTSLKHVKALLRNEPGALERAGGPLRSLPILYAIRFGGSLEVCRFICKQMGHENLKTWRGNYGWTLLHMVTFNKSFLLLPCILSIDPDAVAVKDNQGFTPIDLAKRYNLRVGLRLLQSPGKTISEYENEVAALPLAKETLGKQPRKKKKRRARPLTSVGRRRMINKLKRGAKYRISARTID